MKNLILGILFFAALGFANVTCAQPKTKNSYQKEKRDSLFKQMSVRLELTPDQEVKMKEILTQNQKELKKVKSEVKNQPQEKKQQALKAQFNTNDNRIKSILNPKQQAEYAKIRAEVLAEMKKRKSLRDKKDKTKPTPAEEAADDAGLL